MKQKIIALIMLAILISPLVSADVIIPTVTKVYFEQEGQVYNGKIELTIKGYGYSYPVGPPVEKEPGTYTPEVVFSFTATYENYGNEIYENYYRNYRHIDYYELEGKTEEGKTFIIRNIEKIPTSCDDSFTERNCELKFNLDDADWSFTPSEPNKGFWNKIKCFFRGLFGKSC